jgi:multidrug efflux system outer membrane protein
MNSVISMRPTSHRSPRRTPPAAPRRRLGRIGLACIVAAGLAGCVLGPDYQRPQVPLPTAWHGDMTNAADVANTAWWQGFGDTHLGALIQEALEANRDLRIAAYRVEEYDSRLEVTSSQDYPQANYAIGGQRIHRSQEIPELMRIGAPVAYNQFNVGVNVSWEIDLWGRVKRANEAARAQLLSTEAARRAVMLSVVSGVATSYVELLGLDQQLMLARQTLKDRHDEVDLLTKKYKGGSATKLSVQKADALVAETEALIPDIERQITVLEDALSVLVGRNPGPIARGSIEHFTLPPVPQGVPSDVLLRRPDVQAAEQTLVAANANIGLAKTEYFPTISMTGMLGLASDDLRWLGAKTARTGELDRNIVGTIFNAGRVEGDVRQAEAVHKEMLETYLKTVQTALQEVEDSLAFRAKSVERVSAYNRRLKALQDVSRLSRMRFEGGEATYLEVLDADRDVFEAQSQLAQGRRDEFLALVAVYKAMGGGWMAEQDKLRAAKYAAASSPASDIK